MRLWNDYEGTTIAEIYPIEKLLRPEGRSAFFSTRNGTGTLSTIRLIESVHDEYEILPRWKAVAELKQEHLVSLKKYGQTVFEGTPLLYAVMESTDADLSQVLCDRPLTVDETRELAVSLVEAVQTLHQAGFVHEHIEPVNILARGEVIKLRSDCVREAPEGAEGAALRKKDVHDLAQVLLLALTQRRELPSWNALPLPAPFDRIIRGGLDGTWSLDQIATELMPPQAAPVPAPATESKPTAAEKPADGNAAPMSTLEASIPTQLPLGIPEDGIAPKAPEGTWSATEAPGASSKAAAASAPGTSSPRATSSSSSSPSWTPPRGGDTLAHRSRIALPVEDEGSRRRLWWMIGAAALVLLVVLAVALHHTSKSSAPQPVTTLADVGQPKQAPSSAPAVSHPAEQVPLAHATPAAPVLASGPQWYVVAYTYNHRDQAEHRAEMVNQKTPSLHAEVFSPTGRAPFLVTLGGPRSQAEAEALKDRVRGRTAPRDTYIHNFAPRTHHHRR